MNWFAIILGVANFCVGFVLGLWTCWRIVQREIRQHDPYKAARDAIDWREKRNELARKL